MLNIDYKLAEFCYRSLKKHFRGDIACELGPSTGYMTKLLLNDFKELDIVEGASDLLELIPNDPKLTKYHSLFEDFVPNRKYDTLIMNHILEHIENPVEVLQKISRWMHADSVFLIGVPNAKSFHRLAAVKMGLLSSEYALNDRDVALGHYRVYDLNSLMADATKAGLKIINIGGVFLKFLSNAQIEKVFDEKMISAFYELGECFVENAAEVYIVCEKE